MEPTYLYKVVQKKTRFGSNWAIFHRRNKYHFDTLKEGIKYRKKNPHLFPRYLKDKILQADNETMGFMFFESHHEAINFIVINGLRNTCKIITVEPLSKTKKMSSNDPFIRACGSTIKNLDLVYKHAQDRDIKMYTISPLDVTLCHNIKVLE